MYLYELHSTHTHVVMIYKGAGKGVDSSAGTFLYCDSKSLMHACLHARAKPLHLSVALYMSCIEQHVGVGVSAAAMGSRHCDLESSVHGCKLKYIVLPSRSCLALEVIMLERALADSARSTTICRTERSCAALLCAPGADTAVGAFSVTELPVCTNARVVRTVSRHAGKQWAAATSGPCA